MNYTKALLAGFTATLVMTGFMMLAPHIWLPHMDAGDILGAMFGSSKVVGWIIHFLAGIVFAFIYAGFVDNWLPVENNIARGVIYGTFLAVASEVTFWIINLLGFLKWNQVEDIALMVFGETIACMIYGAILGMFIKKTRDTFLQAKPAGQ